MNPSQILPKQNNIAFRIKQRFLRSWLSSSSPLSRRIGRPRLADPPNDHEGRGWQQAPSPQCSLTRQGQSGHLCFASRLLQLSLYAPYKRTRKAFSHDAQRVRFPSFARRVPGYPIPHEPEKQKKPSLYEEALHCHLRHIVHEADGKSAMESNGFDVYWQCLSPE